MDRSKANNPRLGEVKAVLQRLQKISDEPETGHAGLENDAHQARPGTRRGAIAVVAIAAALALIVVATLGFFNFERLRSATARQAPVAKTTIGVAPGSTAAQL